MNAGLVAGTLFRSAESRTSKAGRPFVLATIRVKDGDGSQFVRIVAFSESVQAELLRLQDGDSLSAQGPLKAEIYTAADGTARVSCLVTDQVLGLRPPKRKAAAANPPAPEHLSSAASGDPDDSIPF